MQHMQTKAVVVPVNEDFLAALVARRETLTTLVWGWQGKSGPMTGPARVLEEDQPHLPFLFSPMDQPSKAVTHAAVSALVVHRREVPATAEGWLANRRVERFAGIEPGPGVASLYVVTTTQPLARPIPYDHLVRVNGGAALSANKRRGYALVYLPAALHEWFEDGCRQWDALSAELPETGPAATPKRTRRKLGAARVS